ncbi:MAG: ParB N-terminal domain-containing protein [Alphaproteobacteria bacterium]|nr:ParB N-terminal domain-containing protein [Alphaproteobacteria bacterium]
MTELMRTITIPLREIYVPTKLSKTLDPAKVETRAEQILESGLNAPVQVRRDTERNRYVLVTGMHRLEAFRALGEETIQALIVQARKH